MLIFTPFKARLRPVHSGPCKIICSQNNWCYIVKWNLVQYFGSQLVMLWKLVCLLRKFLSVVFVSLWTWPDKNQKWPRCNVKSSWQSKKRENNLRKCKIGNNLWKCNTSTFPPMVVLFDFSPHPPIFFFCSNLIFWIVMGCGKADFGRRGL